MAHNAGTSTERKRKKNEKTSGGSRAVERERLFGRRKKKKSKKTSWSSFKPRPAESKRERGQKGADRKRHADGFAEARKSDWEEQKRQWSETKAKMKT